MRFYSVKSLLILILFSFLYYGCNENTVQFSEGTKLSSTYFWKHDTLENNNLPTNIWGNSPTSVWISDNKNMFHYNGDKLKDSLQVSINNSYQSSFLGKYIWGKVDGKPYAVNFQYFDGENWIQCGEFHYSVAKGNLEIKYVTDANTNNKEFYAIGYFEYVTKGTKGVIIHYSDGKFKEIPSDSYDETLNKIEYDVQNNQYYVSGYNRKLNKPTLYEITQFGESKKIEMDSLNCTNPIKLGARVYFYGNCTLWYYNNGDFQEVYDFSSLDYNVRNLGGRSEMEIMMIATKKKSDSNYEYLVSYKMGRINELLECNRICSYKIIGNDLFVISIGDNGKKIFSHGRKE